VNKDKYIKDLEAKLKKFEDIMNVSVEMMDVLSNENESLKTRVKELENLVDGAKGKSARKTSRNSSIPPSKDVDRYQRNKSTRKRSGKNSGGQKGHKGSTLEMNLFPDKVIPIIPKKCSDCGSNLNADEKELVDSRQEIDIPPVKALNYQYDKYSIVCSCGHCNTGSFPKRLKAKVQYGPRMRTWITYLNTYQIIPLKRLKEFFKSAFAVSLSEGTLVNTVSRTAKLAGNLYEYIRTFIEQSKVVGADETVIFSNGKRSYYWAFQNKQASYIAFDETRRKDVILKNFPEGFPNAILTSDRYAAYFSTPAKGHQICWAHLLRDLQFLKETEDNKYVDALYSIYNQAKKLESLKTSNSRNGKKVKRLESDTNDLLLKDINEKYSETKSLLQSLKKHRASLFSFLYNKEVESHNNGTERVFRNAKTKMKVSGQFKSGQKDYAIIRSLIDTLVKNNRPIFESFFNLQCGKDVILGF